MHISFEPPYYNLIRQPKTINKVTYHKFLNWLTGEFDLNLKEENKGLKVYFPNGYFLVKQLKNIDDKIQFEICVKSKSRNTGINIFQKIESTYNQLNRTLL